MGTGFWNISIGQIVIGIPVTALTFYAAKIYGMMLMFRIEHEILMQDWADRQVPKRKLHELHTRQKKWW